jgi:hypothetical protein
MGLAAGDAPVAEKRRAVNGSTKAKKLPVQANMTIKM